VALWEELPLATIAERLTRSQRAVYTRAGELGLALGCPPGHETITASARRTGYAPQTLRKILLAAQVSLCVPRALPSTARCPQQVVEIEAVDRAVASWLSRETPKGAGRRLEVSAALVTNALLAAGHRRPRARKGRRWLLPSATIDAAMASYLARGLSVQAHTARLGVNVRTLTKRLRAAGLLGPPQPGREQRLTVDQVDAVLAAQPVRARRTG